MKKNLLLLLFASLCLSLLPGFECQDVKDTDYDTVVTILPDSGVIEGKNSCYN